MRWSWACVLAAVLLAMAARAGEPSDDAKPAYREQCGACHTAYPPGDLPARSWRVIMGDLPHHFGEDASLDRATTALLRDYVEYYAGGTEAGGTPDLMQDLPPGATPLRITDLPAWRLHHDALLRAGRATLAPGPNAAANCGLCHGSFALP